MRHTLLLILLSVLGISAFSQDSLLNRSKLPKTQYFYDDFLDYSNRWLKFDHSQARGVIKDGFYFFECKADYTSHLMWDDYNIDPTQNYFVEVSFSISKGPEDYGSGLIFNHTTMKDDNSYQFVISPNKYFKVYKEVNNDDIDIKEWTYCPQVNSIGLNKLGIFAKGSYMYFYVNDVLVYNMKRPKHLGCELGFIVARNSTMAIDKFSIRYNPLRVDEVEDASQGFKKVKLGANINSNIDESSPVLSADGKMMFFTRTLNKSSISLEKKTMMYSELDEATGEWGPAQRLPATINQGVNAEVVYVSPDKNHILLHAVTDGSGRFIKDAAGISISHKTADGWSMPENIPVQGLSNLHRYENYTLSSNGKALIMSVQMKGGVGDRDLYVSLKQGDVWSTPKNLGTLVNTSSEDFSPCLAPDGITLYYATNGKPGYGKSDIFMTRRLDDTWQNWTEPKNLGPDINSKFAEQWLQVDAYGQYAYMSEDVNPAVRGEIYKIQVPESARPKPVVIVKGKVYNMLTKQPFATDVLYENMETGFEEGTATSSPEDGSFVLVLPYGTNYAFTANAKGFISESKSLDLHIIDSAKTQFEEKTIDLYLMPLTKGETMKLNNIFFDPDKYDLVPTSFAELDRLYTAMAENPSLTVEISGHTDKGGVNATDENLQELSLNRAGSVKQYLMNKGIDAKRIAAAGYGRTQPVSTNQALNRRVEVKILDL